MNERNILSKLSDMEENTNKTNTLTTDVREIKVTTRCIKENMLDHIYA